MVGLGPLHPAHLALGQTPPGPPIVFLFVSFSVFLFKFVTLFSFSFSFFFFFLLCYHLFVSFPFFVLFYFIFTFRCISFLFNMCCSCYVLFSFCLFKILFHSFLYIEIELHVFFYCCFLVVFDVILVVTHITFMCSSFSQLAAVTKKTGIRKHPHTGVPMYLCIRTHASPRLTLRLPA